MGRTSRGLTPTPYQSGESNHEQGISQGRQRRGPLDHDGAGVELVAFSTREPIEPVVPEAGFGSGTSRMKRTGAVALARKLLIALWRYTWSRGRSPREPRSWLGRQQTETCAPGQPAGVAGGGGPNSPGPLPRPAGPGLCVPTGKRRCRASGMFLQVRRFSGRS